MSFWSHWWMYHLNEYLVFFRGAQVPESVGKTVLAKVLLNTVHQEWQRIDYDKWAIFFSEITKESSMLWKLKGTLKSVKVLLTIKAAIFFVYVRYRVLMDWKSEWTNFNDFKFHRKKNKTTGFGKMLKHKNFFLASISLLVKDGCLNNIKGAIPDV